MTWWPGWDSITGTHWWSNAYFWASIVSLILLGVFEVVSHRYSERKDELAATEQEASQRTHETAIAQLQHDNALLSAYAEASRLEAARQGRTSAIANSQNFISSELLAFATNHRKREDLSITARVFLIVSKLEPFAGTQFDTVVTSDDIRSEVFLNSLHATLITAGWVKIDPVGRPMSQEQASVASAGLLAVQIDVMESSELRNAANALASALNDEGIEAIVIETTTQDASRTNALHIRVIAKAQ